MSTRGTIHRTVRVESELWDQAKAAAAANGENLSDVLRAALRAYIEQHDTRKEAV